MKRRDLLRTGTIASASLGLTGPGPAAGQEPAPLPAGFAPRPFEFEEHGIRELQAGMESGKLTAAALVADFQRRIDEVDRGGPCLRAVIELNPDATAIAEALDRERRESGPRGPLHGIPILLKDNIDTADAMLTTAGSLALVGAKPASDAFVAARLRRAGAVILGKTNMSEWANFRSSHSTSGWSGRGGQTHNPYALDRNPSGSSSGSAAAVAANLATAAVGTETNGSIVSPASACGLVGIKPTVGLISRTGIIPISHSQDTAGPMARTVADAAILLGALAGVDPLDRATAASAGHPCDDYSRFLNPDGLRGARIGVVRRYFGFHEAVDRRIEELLAAMANLGAVIIDPVEIPAADRLRDTSEILFHEFKAGLNAYLAGLGPEAPIRSLAALIEFNEKNRDREMPFFGQDLLIQSETRGPLTSPKYLRLLERNHQLSRRDGIDLVIRRRKLDALVAPTGGPAGPTDWINGDHHPGGYSSLSAVAGYPHITVPAGTVCGLPFGLSFFGRAWTEPKLIALASAFELAAAARFIPRFLPTAALPG